MGNEQKSTGRLVMGYWDCPYCGNKGIKGTLRDCPQCGAPRGEDTKFYMKDTKTYLSEEEAGTKGKGADWKCSFCGALNSVLDENCGSCGASKKDSEENYFQMRQRQQQKTAVLPAPKKATGPLEWIMSHKFLTGFLVVLLIGLIAGIWAAVPHTRTFTCSQTRWETAVDIEQYKTVQEDDWQIPSGGRELYHKKEIHHYNHVVDHYETVQKSREVVDGYDTEYTYEDNGDGTFTEHSHQVPRYKTEYYTEEEPVYVDIPVYKTKYYYEIDKWVVDRQAKEAGKNDHEVRYSDTGLQKEAAAELGNEREGQRHVTYYVTGYFKSRQKEKEMEVGEDIWSKMDPDHSYKVKTVAGKIKEVL